jgi:hypothetical protein
MVVMVILFASNTSAEIFDFEEVSLNGSTGFHQTLNSKTLLKGDFELFVWEALILDSAYLAQEWSELYPDENFHPSKSDEINVNNNSLITQRFKIERENNNALFWICRFNVAEKRGNVNLTPVDMVIEYQFSGFEAGEYIARQRRQKTIFLKLDELTGFEQMAPSLDALYSIEFIVRSETKKMGQLMFDDIKVVTKSALCSD